MLLTDVLVGLAIAVGLVGILVPVLPGSLLVLAAVLVWSLMDSTAGGWVVLGVCAVVLVVGGVVKYAVPGRRLQAAGVPNRTLVAGAVLGVVGFFVIPVIGLVVGFVLGIYLAEVHRVGREAGWPTTVSALRAVGLSMLIELAAGVAAAAVWLVGAVTV